MSFVTPAFFLFFPVAVFLYHLLPKKARWILLLAASYLFYSWHSVWYLGLIVFTTLVSYGCAIRIENSSSAKMRKKAVVLDICLCLFILFLFKYLDFTLNGLFSLGRLLGATVSFDGFHLLLPMGISFYVFQTMSYTVDVYRGVIPAERHLGYYALFVSFFPQLVAGPIERPADLLPQLRQSPNPTSEQISDGICFLLRGYAKKLMVADFIAPFVNSAYQTPETAGGAALILATFLFAVQIYCDFSGYSDIALGCARFFGIRLSENFRRPYAAVSVRDFWRRWHISLGSWFTDYLYIPLGGNRKGLFFRCRNILIVFLVSGLWHGANVTFLLWGGLHGIFLVAETLLFRKKEPAPAPARLLYRGIALCCIGFAWIFFRATDLSHALVILNTIWTDFQPGRAFTGMNMTSPELAVTVLALILLPRLERLPRLCLKPSGSADTEQSCRTALLYFLLTAAIFTSRCLALSGQGITTFIYFQF